MKTNSPFSYHDISVVAAKFPETSETTLIDTYLSDSAEASARLFRIYHPLPAHYHQHCDEHLYLYSGVLVFQIEDSAPKTLRPGQLVTFKRNVVHAVLHIQQHPTIILSFDTPRRAVDDVIFVDSAYAGRKFVSSLE